MIDRFSAEKRWNELINHQRLGVPVSQEETSYRSTFQKDFDRLIFSAAFRRLQDKTQVFPLAQTDYVRTRLTHSLEVSSVCRSLGIMLGEYLTEKYQSLPIRPSDFGAILAAGALAHDIGNPPFGHAGEETISHFFRENPIGQEAISELSIEEKNDFQCFEGNAQAFRLLSRLQNSDNRGGLQLSLPVIASFIKYPRPSYLGCALEDNISFNKFNYFQADKELFKEFASGINLKPHETMEGVWYRHPFAYLLEAADDICYCLIDIEDACRLGLLSCRAAMEFYEAIITANHKMPTARLDAIHREKDKLEYLRAFTIGILIEEIIEAYKHLEEEILLGKYNKSILSSISSAGAIEKIKRFSIQKIYVSDPVLEVGIAGFKVLDTLLEEFIQAILYESRGRGNSKTKMLMHFLPEQFLGKNGEIHANPYIRIMQITDFLSGMTDRYAVKIFKTISGANLSA